jgi:hypothetical protein
MMNTTVKFSEFEDRLRNAVLTALDAEVREVMAHEKAMGWTDSELPVLFSGLDAHIKSVAGRINAGTEPGSTFVQIDIAN